MLVRTLRLLPCAATVLSLSLTCGAHAQQPAPTQPPASPRAPSETAPAAGSPPARTESTGAAPNSAVQQASAEASSDLAFDLEAALVSPDRGMTADEAGRRARARSPQIAVAQANANVAEWDARAQRSNFLPVVQGSAQYKRINKIDLSDALGLPQVEEGGPQDIFTLPVHNYSVAASARLPVSDWFLRVIPSYKGALRIADARAIEVESRTAAVDLQAREAFYGYARALATQLVADQALRQAQAQATQAQLFVGAGTAAPVDLMTATARVESMRGALERAKGAVAIARDRLATLTGSSTAFVAEIAEPVTRLPEPPTGTVEELLARAKEQRPELRAMRKMVEASDRLRTSERNAALPTVSVDGNVLHAQPNPRYFPPNREKFRTSWEVAATLAWSPNNAILGYQRTQRASAELARARADLMALEDGVRMELVQAYEDFKAADAAARASDSQQKAAEETYRVRSATYRVGAGVQIDLLAADLALTQARLDYVNAVLDARIALARLRRAIGS